MTRLLLLLLDSCGPPTAREYCRGVLGCTPPEDGAAQQLGGPLDAKAEAKAVLENLQLFPKDQFADEHGSSLKNDPKRTLPKAQAFGKVASVPAGQFSPKNDDGAIRHPTALDLRAREMAMGPLLAPVGFQRPPKGAKSDADLHFSLPVRPELALPMESDP